MSVLAIAIILISACVHATWNYLAKRSDGGFAFVWLYLIVSTIIYAPFIIGLFVYQEITLGWLGWGFIVGGGCIHLAYALLLQKGYQVGDLSFVYPIARGTGPLIVAFAAMFLFGERLHFLGVIGVSLIFISVFIMTGGLKIFQAKNATPSILYGLVIGVFIASYTLLDKGAVSVVMVPPLLVSYGGIVVQLLILTPFAKRDWKQIRMDWKYHRKEVIGVGILNPLAYLLVLITMTFTPVSYVAPVREVSILIGALMGTYLLKEGFGIRRMIASIIMVVGIAAIAMS